ncbi:unnamed protein product [Allacma fusca]|uniref:Ig-like domain-containing protein n=1 Tax=Allacma fusca TaxID=39272 RepID=A0A8J2KM05_9HEXA|nr:unnamed protein product [Allacma fusca]
MDERALLMLLGIIGLDAPVCKQAMNVVVGVSKGERVSIKCELEADPEDVNFRWDLATSGQMIQVSPSKFANSGSTSLIHYSPASTHDYGSLFCRGSNVVGTQMAPCVFQVVAAAICLDIYHGTNDIRSFRKNKPPVVARDDGRG